jgi:hypothetical protein
VIEAVWLEKENSIALTNIIRIGVLIPGLIISIYSIRIF